MKLPRRRFLHLSAGAAAFAAFPRVAPAQSYPSRPITVVVPYNAGTAMDVVVRIVSEHMPPEIVIAKLNAAIVDALADANVRQRLADIGQEIFPREQQTPEALRAYQKSEIEKWWPIIKGAGIKPE